MRAKKIYEAVNFQRGEHPYDSLDIGNKEFRILKKFKEFAGILGLEDAGIEDLNKQKAIASWRLRNPLGQELGRITFFRKGEDDKPPYDMQFGVYTRGKRGPDVESWEEWGTLKKWKYHLEYNFDVIYESLRFERGKNPKKEIGLGKERPFEPGDRVILLGAFNREPFDKGTVLRIQDDGGVVVAAEDYARHQPEIVMAPELLMREFQNFERGKDPLHTMGIGQVNKIMELLDKVQKSLNRGSLIPSLEENEGLYLRVFGVSPPRAFELIKKNFGTSYFDWGKNYTKLPSIYFKIKPEFEDLFISAYNKLNPDKKFIKESIDFERSKDPKEILKIGKNWRFNKNKSELEKVMNFFKEDWLGKQVEEYAKELDDMGIEILELRPEITKPTYSPWHPVVYSFFKLSNGKEMESVTQISKQLRYDSKESYFVRTGQNVLYSIVEDIKWHEHEF